MRRFLRLLIGAAACGLVTVAAHANVTIDPYFAGRFSVTSLGSAAGVLANYGGLTIELGDSGSLLLGGSANHTNAKIYSVPLVRDTSGHVTGFGGTAGIFSSANGVSGGIDGGLTYGPGGVLFYTSYSDNRIGQIEPGSSGPDRSSI